MTTTTTETASAAPIESGWTDNTDHGPLYVSPPDPDLDGDQAAIQLCATRHKDTGVPSVRITFLGDVAALEDRDGIYEEINGEFLGGDTYWLDAEACAGLAAYLLTSLAREGMTSRMSQVTASAAFKFLEHHAEHA